MNANAFLALEGLASSGCVIPSEKRAALDISLLMKQQATGLAYLTLWGCLCTTNGKDYLLAQGFNTMQKLKKKTKSEYQYYFSQDGKEWLDLHPISEELYEKCKEIKENFRGDVGATFFVPNAIQPPPIPKLPKQKPALYVPQGAPQKPIFKLSDFKELKTNNVSVDLKHEVKQEVEGKGKKEASGVTNLVPQDNPQSLVKETIWDEMDDVPKLPKHVEQPQDLGPQGVEIRELERLYALIRWIDEECSVVPIGALVLTTSKRLVENTIFDGVSDLDKLHCYGKLMQGYDEALLSDDVNGVWTLHVEPLTKEVTIRSCHWPGYYFYYSHLTKAWGSMYFGMGFKETIDQVAFMV